MSSNPFESPQSNDIPPDRTRMRLKSVGVLSSGIYFAAAGVLTGLVAGGFMLLASLAGMVGAGAGSNETGMAIGIGVGALILAPIFYGLAGFLGGLIWAFIYNIVAGMTGGIEMEFGRD